MTKVLIVDDDKLVRKGLISAMPWSDFGMEVIGEANNGEKALEFMKSNAVDLLLTDLAMPVMSGIELMRVVRSRYPHIHMVVLTLHQDFEYVQEALRLGAIDYIAKVQLEKERFEEVLGRIYRRLEQDRHQGAAGAAAAGSGASLEQGAYTAETGAALMPLNNEQDSGWLLEWSEETGVLLTEVDLQTWLWVPAGEGASAAGAGQLPDGLNKRLPEGWVWIELLGMGGMQSKEVQRLLREYREKELFYDYDPKQKPLRLELHREAAGKPVFAEEEVAGWKALWLTYEWVHRQEAFDRLLSELKRLRLPQAKLFGLLYSLVDDWYRVFDHMKAVRLELPASFDCWVQTAGWLELARDTIRTRVGQSSYSDEVIQAVMKAKSFVHQELERPLTALDIAKRVSMSRGYFSQCFKDIAGKTFNDYLRQARVDKAKEYLLHTSKTIVWIAENTGYADEKYFSRTFRELTGVLPSEYRAMGREGREMSAKQGERR